MKVPIYSIRPKDVNIRRVRISAKNILRLEYLGCDPIVFGRVLEDFEGCDGSGVKDAGKLTALVRDPSTA